MKILEKWHSIGNDFLISTNPKIEFTKTEIIRLMERNFGIGADQFVILHQNKARFFNPDGSEAEICGNALKCIAEILLKENVSRETLVETKKGIIKVFKEGEGFGVNLGEVLDFKELEEGFFVNLGNPHLVIFCKEDMRLNFFESNFVNEIGMKMQSRFHKTNGINVSFALPSAEGLLVRTFERGVGETLSCGSGSSASFFASLKKGFVKGETKVFNKGSKKVLDFKESYHLISYSNQGLILKGKGTKLGKVTIE